eukprot:scpid36573/ scgid3265/ 
MRCSNTKLSATVWLMVVVTLDLRTSSFVQGLMCNCNDGEMCNLRTKMCRTKDSAACVTYVYPEDGVVAAEGGSGGGGALRRALLCSESGFECPRPGDPPGFAGSRMHCCRENFCNSETGPLPTDPASVATVTSSPTPPPPSALVPSVPPSSGAKLRCDCTPGNGACRQDRGGRGKYHCLTSNGWCVAVAGRITASSPVVYSRFCTNDLSDCEQTTTRNSQVKCCSDSRFCNERLTLSLSNDTDSVVTDNVAIDHDVVQRTTALSKTNVGASTAGLPVTSLNVDSADGSSSPYHWCHCNTLQCNDSFPYCRTAGKCQIKSHIHSIAFKPTLRCVEPAYVSSLCSERDPCCTGDCCNDDAPCRTWPQSTSMPAAPVNTRSEYTCHCSKCSNHECRTKLGCIVNVDTMTNTSEQDCIRGYFNIATHCRPSFTRSNSTTSSRVIGNVHSYCCHGNKCNARHPDFKDVVGDKTLFCYCENGGCNNFDTRCITSLHGGQCYAGPEGKFCINPDETEKLAKLCDGGKHCCNTSHCNQDVSDQITTGPLDMKPATVTSQPVKTTSQLNNGDDDTDDNGDVSGGTGGKNIDQKQAVNVLYICAAIAGVLLVGLVVMVVIMVRARRRHASKSSSTNNSSARPGRAHPVTTTKYHQTRCMDAALNAASSCQPPAWSPEMEPGREASPAALSGADAGVEHCTPVSERKPSTLPMISTSSSSISVQSSVNTSPSLLTSSCQSSMNSERAEGQDPSAVSIADSNCPTAGRHSPLASEL